MTSQVFFFSFIPILSIILLSVNFIFAPHNPYEEKDSPFECGFHSFLGQNRSEFSISFFIFALLFLLFDLEILLIYPYVVSAYSNAIFGLIIMLIFFIVLTLGLVFELGKNALTIESRQDSSISTEKKNGWGNFIEKHAFIINRVKKYINKISTYCYTNILWLISLFSYTLRIRNMKKYFILVFKTLMIRIRHCFRRFFHLLPIYIIAIFYKFIGINFLRESLSLIALPYFCLVSIIIPMACVAYEFKSLNWKNLVFPISITILIFTVDLKYISDLLNIDITWLKYLYYTNLYINTNTFKSISDIIYGIMGSSTGIVMNFRQELGLNYGQAEAIIERYMHAPDSNLSALSTVRIQENIYYPNHLNPIPYQNPMIVPSIRDRYPNAPSFDYGPQFTSRPFISTNPLTAEENTRGTIMGLIPRSPITGGDLNSTLIVKVDSEGLKFNDSRVKAEHRNTNYSLAEAVANIKAARANLNEYEAFFEYENARYEEAKAANRTWAMRRTRDNLARASRTYLRTMDIVEQTYNNAAHSPQSDGITDMTIFSHRELKAGWRAVREVNRRDPSA